jgi:hypothetical protein
MSFIIINNKKYFIKNFNTCGNNKGYIDFSKNKIGKILYLSEKRKNNNNLDTEYYNECNKIINSNLTSNLVRFYKYY